MLDLDKISVSIIVPNYNHERFLEQRLQSIFNQTYQDFEVILLDDASTDKSVEILSRYRSHPKVKHFIKNKENSGSPFLQWKKGIDLSKGEFIWIAESDDVSEDQFLEKLLDSIQKDTVIVYSASKVIDDNGHIIKIDDWALRMDWKKWSSNYVEDGKTEVKEYLRYRNTIPNASAVLFRKEAIRTIKFPTNLYYCGDWYIWLQLASTGKVSYLKTTLNSFRKHTSSTRSFRNETNEIKRFREYFFIIKKTSGVQDRIANIKYYDWILSELREKEAYLGYRFFFKINMPFPFLLRYLKLL